MIPANPLIRHSHKAYNLLHLAGKYFRYYLTAYNGEGHGMHSPFVFDFITKVMTDKTVYSDYAKAEGLRKKMWNDNRMISVEDMGAGSHTNANRQRTITSIVRNAAKPPKFGQLLYRMAKYYKPGNIIELGTSLGITTAYLALADSSTKVYTIEGATEIRKQAIRNFSDLGLKNIESLGGNFDEILPSLLSGLNKVDFAFIDGNHRRQPTENYFQMLLPKLHNDSILVFDDIHWSREMEEAWKTILQHDSVTCSVDLFFIGLVFFRQEFKEKQGFSVRF